MTTLATFKSSPNEEMSTRGNAVWRFTSIGLSDWQTLSADSRSIEADSHGDKVLLCADNSYLKIFYRRRLLSSQIWSPLALRFANNCRRLEALQIPCPDVIQVYRVPAIARDVAHYRPLPGITLKQLLQQGVPDGEACQLRRQIGVFIARLHNLGIYFRSLHFNNVVLTPSETLGLIDVGDLRCYRRPLSNFQRKRNFRHLQRYALDNQWLWQTGDFFEAYSAAPPA